MLPEGATITCTAGTGRLIDYWIVTDRARLLLERPRLVRGTPWKTHSGIAVDLVPLATLIQGTILVKSKAILSEATKASTDRIVPIHDKWWHESAQAHKVGVARHGARAQKSPEVDSSKRSAQASRATTGQEFASDEGHDGPATRATTGRSSVAHAAGTQSTCATQVDRRSGGSSPPLMIGPRGHIMFKGVPYPVCGQRGSREGKFTWCPVG